MSLHTVVELPEFLNRASGLLAPSERAAIVNYLAEHPLSGVLIKGAGGIRKLRWSARGKGKSGGVRVIYFYHDASIPLFLLTVFGKSDKADLSKKECNVLASLTSFLVKHYGEQHE